jgi:hypothetical protein
LELLRRQRSLGGLRIETRPPSPKKSQNPISTIIWAWWHGPMVPGRSMMAQTKSETLPEK